MEKYEKDTIWTLGTSVILQGMMFSKQSNNKSTQEKNLNKQTNKQKNDQDNIVPQKYVSEFP
jgi:hypothetical protein